MTSDSQALEQSASPQPASAETIQGGIFDADSCLIDGPGDFELVRRELAVFRRLEPGDQRQSDAYAVAESPYVEAKVVWMALRKSRLERMRELADARSKALALPNQWFLRYEPFGMIFATGGGMGVATWLDFLPSYFIVPNFFRYASLVIVAISLVAMVIARKKRVEIEMALEKAWHQSPLHKEHGEVAAALLEAYKRASGELRKRAQFLTDLRVAEGSANPIRLCSIDPRPFEHTPDCYFDPEDFLPTEVEKAKEGEGPKSSVRYEVLLTARDIETRLLNTALGQPSFPEKAR